MFKRMLGLIKVKWKAAVIALLLLFSPLISFYACKLSVMGCVKLEESRDARGFYDEYYCSFDELAGGLCDNRYDDRSIAWRIEEKYGLILPDEAELIYARSHSYWQSSETFFVFRLCPREIAGYSSGMNELDVIKLITNNKYRYEYSGAVSLCAESIEEETLQRAPKYDGDDHEFIFCCSANIRFSCGLYCTRADPDEMIFALSYIRG